MRQTKKSRFCFLCFVRKKTHGTCVSFDAFYVIWLRGDFTLSRLQRASVRCKQAGWCTKGLLLWCRSGQTRRRRRRALPSDPNHTRGARVYLLTGVLACISLLLVRPIRIYVSTYKTRKRRLLHCADGPSIKTHQSRRKSLILSLCGCHMALFGNQVHTSPVCCAHPAA